MQECSSQAAAVSKNPVDADVGDRLASGCVAIHIPMKSLSLPDDEGTRA